MSRAVFVSAAPSSPWHGCVLCLFFFFKSQIKIIFPKSCSCLCPGDGGEPAVWWAFRMGGRGLLEHGGEGTATPRVPSWLWTGPSPPVTRRAWVPRPPCGTEGCVQDKCIRSQEG